MAKNTGQGQCRILDTVPRKGDSTTMVLRFCAISTMLLLASSATAGPNDFRLNAPDPSSDKQGILYSVAYDNDDKTPELVSVNSSRFVALVSELAYVFSPRSASPAETLGHSGFHVGVLWSGTSISANEPYWLVTEEGQRSRDPNSFLQTLQLDVRKGLPLSFEIGTNFLWLVESEMFAPGVEIRWALHEGYHLAPDLGIRGTVNHVVGNRDINMTVVGLDATLSRSFGIGGVLNLAPYLSYAVLLTNVSSRVIDATGNNDKDEADLKFPSIRLGDNVQHKLTIGSRVLISVFHISLQGEFEFLPKVNGGREAFGSVATLATKLGLNY